jgi:hypothetical protein
MIQLVALVWIDIYDEKNCLVCFRVLANGYMISSIPIVLGVNHRVNRVERKLKGEIILDLERNN